MTAGAIRAAVPARALHGRRAGRPLRPGLAARMDRLLPDLAVPAAGPIDPASLFGAPLRGVRLEIGFGSGEHLAAEAAAAPHVGFIGCEPFRNGVAKMIERIETLRLDNVRLVTDDAGALLPRLSEGALDRVDLLYPDPWPKRRHRARRFVSEARLAELARAMRPGAELRFATDIDDYAGWTLARVLGTASFAWRAADAEDWRAPWPGWRPTRYEEKAVRAGRTPVYLTFVRRG